jgi:hypothetical protein
VHEVVKGADPTTHTPICGGDDRGAINGATARVVELEGSGNIFFRSLMWNFDANEEVDSCPINPQFVNDATRLECSRFVA